jgi:hypothetical protein
MPDKEYPMMKGINPTGSAGQNLDIPGWRLVIDQGKKDYEIN